MKLGDKVEKVTKATGIKKAVKMFSKGRDCGCNKRKEKLNKLFTREKPKCLTEKQYNTWKEFQSKREIRLTEDQIKMICKLYANVFQKPYYEPPVNSSLRPVIEMINKIDKVYDTYKEKK